MWIWRKGIITTWWLDDDTLQYVGIDESRVLAGIDLKQLMRFLEAPTTAQAIRAYRAALGG